MPLKLNIGLSRKIGESNYGSRGASVNLEAEVDSSLANEPVKLHERIRQLFALVRTALAEELNGGHGNGQLAVPAPARVVTPSTGNDFVRNGRTPRTATQAQVKAIHAIARSQHLDVSTFLQQHFHVEYPQDLSIREASQAIDQLKSTQAPAAR